MAQSPERLHALDSPAPPWHSGVMTEKPTLLNPTVEVYVGPNGHAVLVVKAKDAPTIRLSKDAALKLARDLHLVYGFDSRPG